MIYESFRFKLKKKKISGHVSLANLMVPPKFALRMTSSTFHACLPP